MTIFPWRSSNFCGGRGCICGLWRLSFRLILVATVLLEVFCTCILHMWLSYLVDLLFSVPRDTLSSLLKCCPSFMPSTCISFLG